jgi:hypothetical protein
MADKNVRSFNSFISETSNVRDVSSKMLLLEQDRTPLYVLTNNSKRKVPTTSPRIEWFEDADLGMIGTVSNGTTNYASNATGVFVSDVTLFGVNDIVQVPKAASSSTVDELVLVTAVSGTTNGTLTVSRGFAGTTADTIGATVSVKILGVAQTENGAIDSPRAPVKNPKTSGAQIFEWPVQLTRTAASTKVYGDRPERARLQMLGMRRQKMEIENAGLFGSFSESLSSPGSRYTSLGVRSIISSFITDAGNTLTYQTFLSFSRFAFRFGSTEKLLIAAPIVKEALDYIAGNKQLIKEDTKLFGVSLKKFVTSNGTWMLANNYNMDGGNADEAIGIDLPSIEYAPLVENGINNDTQLILDYDKTNPKVIKDLVFTQAGWRIWHQARHARLFDVGAYA